MKGAHIASIILWSIAGLLLIASLVVGAWWVDPTETLRLGLASYEVCNPDRPCVTYPFQLVDRYGNEPDRLWAFVWAGRATFALSMALIAASLLGVLLLVVKRKHHGYLIVFITATALLVAALVFVIAFAPPTEVPLPRGRSLYLTFGAIVVALAGCGMHFFLPSTRAPVAAAPWRPPVRHGSAPPAGPWSYTPPKKPDTAYAPPGLDAAAQASASVAAPVPCPRCAAPMTMNTDHGRHYCAQCQTFV